MTPKKLSLIVVVSFLVITSANNMAGIPFAAGIESGLNDSERTAPEEEELSGQTQNEVESASTSNHGTKLLPGYDGAKGGYGSDDTDLSSSVFYYDGARSNTTYNVYNKTLVPTSIADNFDLATNLTARVDSVSFPRANTTVQGDNDLTDRKDITNMTVMEFRVLNSSVLHAVMVNLTVTAPGTLDMNVSIFNSVNEEGDPEPGTILHSQNINVNSATSGEMHLDLGSVYLNASDTFKANPDSYSFFVGLRYPTGHYKWLFEDDDQGDYGKAYGWNDDAWLDYNDLDFALKVDSKLLLTPFEAMIAANGTRVDDANTTQDLAVRSESAAYNMTCPFADPNMTITTFATSCNESSIDYSYLVHPSHNNVTWTMSIDVQNTFRNGAAQNSTVLQIPSNWTVLKAEIDGAVVNQGDGYTLSESVGAKRNMTLYDTNTDVQVSFESSNLITSSLDLYVLEGSVWTSSNICYAGTVNKNDTGVGGQNGDRANLTSSLGLTTGTANISLFDTDSVILRNTSFGDYVDTENSTWVVDLDASGRLSVQTALDPNVTLGMWTWRLQWCNGTQAGVAEVGMTVLGVAETQLVTPVGDVARIIDDPSIQIEVAVLDRTHNLDLGTSFEADWAFSTEDMIGSSTNTTHFIHSASLSLAHTETTDGTFTVTVSINQANFDEVQHVFDVTIYQRGKADFAPAGGPFYFGMEYQLEFTLVNETSGIEATAYNESNIAVVVITAFDHSLDFNVTGHCFILSIDTASVRATQSHSITIQMQYGSFRSDVATPIMQDEANVFVSEVPTTILSNSPENMYLFTDTSILFSYRDDLSLQNLSQYDLSNEFNLTADQYVASWGMHSKGTELILQITDTSVKGVNITVGFMQWGHENHTESYLIRIDHVPTQASVVGDPDDVTMYHDAEFDVQWDNMLNGSGIPDLGGVDIQVAYNVSLLDVYWEYDGTVGTLTLHVQALYVTDLGSTLNITIGQSGFQTATTSLQIDVIPIPIDTDDIDTDIYLHHTNEVIVPLADGIDGSSIPSALLTFELVYDGSAADISWEYQEANRRLVLTIIPIVTDAQSFDITIQLSGSAYGSIEIVVNAEMRLCPTELNWILNGSTTLVAQDNQTVFVFQVRDDINSLLVHLAVDGFIYNGSMEPLLEYGPDGYTLTILVCNLDAGQTVRVELILVSPGYESQSIYLEIMVLPLDEYSLDVDCTGDLVWDSTLVVTVTLVVANESISEIPLHQLINCALNPSSILINATAMFDFENGTFSTITQSGYLGDQYRVYFSFWVPENAVNVTLFVSAEGLGLKYTAEELEPIRIAEKRVSSGEPDEGSWMIVLVIVAILSIVVIGGVLGLLQYLRSRDEQLQLANLSPPSVDLTIVPRLIEQTKSLSTLLIVDSESGLPVFSHGVESDEASDLLVSGFLQAISSFGQAMAGEDEIISEISYRNFSINSCRAGRYGVYLISRQRLGPELKLGFEMFSLWFACEFGLQAHGKNDYNVNRDGIHVLTRNKDKIVQASRIHLFAWATMPLGLVDLGDTKRRRGVQKRIVEFIEMQPRSLLSGIVEELGEEYEGASIIRGAAVLVKDGVLGIAPQISSLSGVHSSGLPDT